MKKSLIIVLVSLLIMLSSISLVSAYYGTPYDVEDFHEMNGTIMDRDGSGEHSSYLIKINDSVYYLSSHDAPYQEFNIGDNVTMNGTIVNEYTQNMYSFEFDGKYDGKVFTEIVLQRVAVDQKTYGQMRLTADVDNPYYYNVDSYN